MSLAVAFTCNSCGCHVLEPVDSLAEVADIVAVGPPAAREIGHPWTVLEFTDGRRPPILVLCGSCTERQAKR